MRKSFLSFFALVMLAGCAQQEQEDVQATITVDYSKPVPYYANLAGIPVAGTAFANLDMRDPGLGVRSQNMKLVRLGAGDFAGSSPGYRPANALELFAFTAAKPEVMRPRLIVCATGSEISYARGRGSGMAAISAGAKTGIIKRSCNWALLVAIDQPGSSA